jgi:hypothetical protein
MTSEIKWPHKYGTLSLLSKATNVADFVGLPAKCQYSGDRGATEEWKTLLMSTLIVKE